VIRDLMVSSNESGTVRGKSDLRCCSVVTQLAFVELKRLITVSTRACHW
jgi:hypothetical protein